MQKSQHTGKYKRLIDGLYEARLKSGLTQIEATKQMGSYSTFITKIESGERKIDVVELSQLCKVYGIKLQAFLKMIGLE